MKRALKCTHWRLVGVCALCGSIMELAAEEFAVLAREVGGLGFK